MQYEYSKLTLTASSYNNKISVEIPMDSANNEVFEAFRTLMIGLTYAPQSFDDAVARYFYEHGLDKGE